MVSEVNKLIYNALLRHGAVAIPGVGTIFVERTAACYGSHNRVVAPRYSLNFSTTREAVSLIDIISAEASVDTLQSQDIYERWLDKVRTSHGVEICGVGTINHKSFVADEALLAALNIGGGEQINITKKRKSRRGLVLGLMISLVAVAVSLYNNMEKLASNEHIQDVVEIIPDETFEEQGSEQYVVEDTTEPVTEPIIDVVEPISDWRDNNDIRHWVVVGSYSTQENAERAISDLEKRYSDMLFTYFKLGSMYAVSPFGSADKADCEMFISEYKDSFPQVWVYTPKQYK
ncbi:MAG: SPOR domain-containing protein [Alistipes sp.]|nr:SPOR domain-containing protein [Alistipes sp.]